MTGLEARTEHLPTIYAASASWPSTEGGEQLPEMCVTADGVLQLPRGKDLVGVKKERGAPVAATKIKVHPRNQADHERLRQVFGAVRWTYNRCVATLKDPAARKELQHDYTCLR